MAILKVVGFDPSLRHWGVASGAYDTLTNKIEVSHVDVLEATVEGDKTVRKSSKDLSSATQLYTGAAKAAKGANAIFVEVPHGSQSARAMAGYAICVGVLGALRASGIHFYELTQREVKLGSFGKTKATKQQMINWAMATFPSAPWPHRKQNGELFVVKSKAEHEADAAATIFSGVQLPAFQQSIQLINTQTL